MKAHGRPTDYSPDFDEKFYKAMAEGLTMEAACGLVGTTKANAYEWLKVHPSFSDAVSRGRSAQQLWWENTGRAGIVGKLPRFSAAGWIFVMKNLFKWQDNSMVEVLSDPRNSEVVQTQLEVLKQKFDKLLVLERERQQADDDYDAERGNKNQS
ncbi:hypothetical protein [Microcystis sp. M061S2]|uniref:hypothetical protein n=1 Tax=Microcystis sp. M061S2 TaxID=2771171 RepID=UPI0025875100|nr:hypothetical protein [Microcystis sp. M061S2]MCA2654534.1 hypothetical protein [Microcystis sp. M061S2]